MKVLDNLRQIMQQNNLTGRRHFPHQQGMHTLDHDHVDLRHGTILYVENVTVSFDGFKALNDLTLYIEAGELRCIIGPNGAGKTTMRLFGVSCL